VTPADVVEALLFASDGPLEPERIREVLDLGDADEARALVDELRQRYAGADRALAIAEVAGGFRMVTRPDVAPWLLKLAKTRTRARLSRPALETLAIVAYRQPVSRPEVDAVRGVNSEGVLDSLLERRLVRIAGRKEAPGRPFLYETTREFLIAFGLRDLGELPKVDGELKIPDLADPAGADGAPPAAPGAGPPDAGATADGAAPAGAGEPVVAEPAVAELEDVEPAAVAAPGPAVDPERADGQPPAEQAPGAGGDQLPAGR
jgi:segregation and condensation protein B